MQSLKSVCWQFHTFLTAPTEFLSSCTVFDFPNPSCPHKGNLGCSFLVLPLALLLSFRFAVTHNTCVPFKGTRRQTLLEVWRRDCDDCAKVCGWAPHAHDLPAAFVEKPYLKYNIVYNTWWEKVYVRELPFSIL